MELAHPAAKQMVEQQLRGRGIRDAAVLSAMGRAPRHLFVPQIDPETAYADRALPTAEGQTISQPYMVALMTELLQIEPDQTVLEIGTGSGYQTAILALLGGRVTTVERSEGLSKSARNVLEQIGLAEGVRFVLGDGTRGWPGGSPFDRILVTAGALSLPPAYTRQLSRTGRIVIPIGDRHEQKLHCFHWGEDEMIDQPGVPCRFVPLVGVDGWETLGE